ncbi:MAG: 4-(cytidine 5'-diphospho)-2-C-methyl-D-erythritol kinase [Oscillospiraceae bacterium]|nr:4-(cytidine 5'-diphospho)-2-C-methyl-D-erythritol kinase [Oscillospiraceae bacterium]
MKLSVSYGTIDTMDMIYEKAYAKLNISLDVSKPREDGYHDMVMVMQTVTLCDDITIRLLESGPVTASSNLRYIPGDDRNLAVKAAKLYLKKTGREQLGAKIHIQKRIPVGAGMAGGSSDAAAVLRGLNTAFGNELSRNDLMILAGATGSDVAFCLLGGTALAEGRGEILTPLRPFPDCFFVICKPEYSVSTPELFQALDKMKIRVHPDTQGLLEAVKTADLKQICRRMYNVFEDVPDRRMKTIAEIKRKLMNAGAQGAIMTGTGSAVFGVFPDENKAVKAAEELGKEYPFSVTAVPKGMLLV